MAITQQEPKAIKIGIAQTPPLPNTYQEVTYIEFTGTQVLATDVSSLTAPFKVEVTFVKSNTSTSDQTLVGQRQIGKFVNIYNNYYENIWSSSAAGTGSADDDIHTIITDSSAGLYKDGTLLVSGTSGNRSSSYPLLIGAFSEDSYSSAKWFLSGRIYGVKMTSNGSLYRNYVPCYRKSDGVIGMYETQTNTFLTNLGTGTLGKGDNVYYNDTPIKAIYIGTNLVRPEYSGEMIVYKMNADNSGNLYIPVAGYATNGTQEASYSWKVSVDGGAETTYSGTGRSGGSITLSGYTANTSHKIIIKPTSESYGWARAFGWNNTSGRPYLTEVVYDGSLKGYVTSATNTGIYYKYYQYAACSNLTKVPTKETMLDTITTIADYSYCYQYYGCSSLLFAPEEALPNGVTSIGSSYRSNQYSNCFVLSEIKGWREVPSNLSASNYRVGQYQITTSVTLSRTVKVLTNVGLASANANALPNSYVGTVYVPSAYLNNFKNATTYPRSSIDDSKFVGY